MGMAASQARFLGLTARKTNVEFEGQQINQQRTTLSNQSANYYNQLLGMSVPVAPSVEDYTKTVYTFNDGALTNTITSLVATGNGKYTVSYLREWNDDFAAVSAATSIVTNDGGSYFVGSTELRKMDENVTFTKNADGTVSMNGAVIDDPYLSSLNQEQLDGLAAEEAAYIEALNSKYGEGDGWYIRYVQNSTSGAYVPYFYKANEIEDASKYETETGRSIANINCYTMGTDKNIEEVKAVQDCQVEQDSTGRYISISIPDADGNMVTYALTTETVTDQEKYDDAMNQYEYNKYLYDQTIQEINAKIEITQAEDKNLELRLKQLDTEQSAIQTEMDAVEKVIEKNTESTFKTFG